jgi:hypothetical protein
LEAASHGRFTEQEASEFSSAIRALALVDAELMRVRSEAYRSAVTAVAAQADVTDQDEADIARIQSLLQIPTTEISGARAKLARLRTISDARHGILPIIADPLIILQKDERPHWRTDAKLLEERVVARRYEGGSQGVSIRLAKGVSWRVGAQRGHIVSETAVIPISVGNFVVTDKRLVFSGDGKSFSVAYPKLLDAHMYADGIRVTPSSGKPYLLQFPDVESADVVGAIVSQILKNVVAA